MCECILRIEVNLRRDARGGVRTKAWEALVRLTYIEIKFEMETINAVPTPLLDVGDIVLTAQLLRNVMR